MHPKALIDESARLLEKVFRFEHPADAVVARHFQQNRSLGPRERATLADTVFAVLRERLKFEWLARSGSGALWRRLAILGFPGDRDFLKSALSDAEKTWWDQCLAVPESGFLPQHRHNLPDWLASPLKAQLGEQFQACCDSLLQPAPLDLRVNALKKKRDAVLAELPAAGLDGFATPYSPLGIRLRGKPSLAQWPAFAHGEVEVQDEGSQLLALLLDARRGEMVVDFCAGAGGKTLAIGASMRNSGRLYAFDTSAHRLDALKPRLGRSGLSNVHPVVIANERDERIKRLAGKMDRVLVDAPCSGLGTLRRNPDLKWRQTPDTVSAMAALQAAILASAARLLKPGGRLVYATCSPLALENESVVQAFTASQPGFEPLSAVDLLLAQVPNAQELASDAATDLAARAHEHQASRAGEVEVAGATSGHLRLWPHRHGTDGFFAAAWKRRA